MLGYGVRFFFGEEHVGYDCYSDNGFGPAVEKIRQSIWNLTSSLLRISDLGVLYVYTPLWYEANSCWKGGNGYVGFDNS